MYGNVCRKENEKESESEKTTGKKENKSKMSVNERI